MRWESSIGSQSLGTDNFLAYDRFLLARQYYNRGSFESLATAKSYYLEAIELDPDFREAWRDYARAVFKQWNTGSISPSRAVHEMHEAVDRVAAIDAVNPSVWSKFVNIRWPVIKRTRVWQSCTIDKHQVDFIIGIGR